MSDYRDEADEIAELARFRAQRDMKRLKEAAAPVANDEAPADLCSDPWIESQIPPRPWIADGTLLRGAVTLFVGQGGSGKSSAMIAWSACLALGRQFGRLKPRHACNVLVLNAEDGREEQQRRYSALLRQFGAEPSALSGKVFTLHPRKSMRLFERSEDRDLIETHLFRQIERVIEERQIDVVILDPLVELSDADENSNNEMGHLTGRFRELANKHNIAVILVHHVRKGSSGGGG